MALYVPVKDKKNKEVAPTIFVIDDMSLLEAMSCGLPCISSDFDGFNQIITPNLNNALVVERNNIDQLASNMETLYKDHHLRNKLSNTCFEDIKSNYTFDEIYIDWHNLITDLI